MPISIKFADLLNAKQLSDGDVIHVTITEGNGSKDEIIIGLELRNLVSWWKEYL